MGMMTAIPTRKTLMTGAAVLAALIAVTFAIFSLWPGFAASQLRELVLEQTGLALEARGGAHLEFAPQLAIRIDDVAIQNADGSDGHVVQVRSVRIALSGSELLRRKISLDRLQLIAPAFTFTVDSSGQPNWTGGAKSNRGVDSGDAGGRPRYPSITFLIDEGSASYSDMRSGTAFVLKSYTGTIAMSRDGEILINGTSEANGRLIRTDAYLKSLARVAEGGSPFDLSVTAPQLTLEFNGRLAVGNALNLAGQTSVSSSDFRDIVKWLGVPIGGISGLGQFYLTAALDSENGTFSFKDARLSLDNVTARGEAKLDMSRTPPRITGQMSLSRLDLNDYLPKAPSEAGAGEASWSENAIDFAAIATVDAQFQLAVERLIYESVEIGPVNADAAIQSGKLTARLRNASLYGGTAEGQVTADGSGPAPSLALSLNGSGIDARRLFRDAAGIEWLDGRAAIDIDVATSGASEQEMIGRLGGHFDVHIEDGAIAGLPLAAAVAGLGSAGLDGWPGQDGANSPFALAAARFSLADGIATSSDIVFDGETISATGKGDIDLLRRDLDLSFLPRIASGENGGQNALMRVAVKGPWDRPKIKADLTSMLEEPEQAIKALENAGKKLLKGLTGD